MTCSEDRLIAFLSGELSPEESRRFDEHLLGCESCWQAAQDDRAARHVLVRLREPAPSDLADRIALAVEVSSERAASVDRDRAVAFGEMGAAGRRATGVRWRRVFVPAIGAVAAAGLAVGLLVSTGPSSPMPAQVEAVADVAAPMSYAAVLPSARSISVDGETMHVRFFLVDRLVVTVATATRPFPMLPAQDLERGSSDRSWLATMGNLGVFCMNHARGSESMLVVAKMPTVELPAVAVRLHLI